MFLIAINMNQICVSGICLIFDDGRVWQCHKALACVFFYVKYFFTQFPTFFAKLISERHCSFYNIVKLSKECQLKIMHKKNWPLKVSSIKRAKQRRYWNLHNHLKFRIKYFPFCSVQFVVRRIEKIMQTFLRTRSHSALYVGFFSSSHDII